MQTNADRCNAARCATLGRRRPTQRQEAPNTLIPLDLVHTSVMSLVQRMMASSSAGGWRRDTSVASLPDSALVAIFSRCSMRDRCA